MTLGLFYLGFFISNSNSGRGGGMRSTECRFSGF